MTSEQLLEDAEPAVTSALHILANMCKEREKLRSRRSMLDFEFDFRKVSSEPLG